MAICEFLISQDVTVNCSSPLHEGVEPLAFIINKADIASVSQTGSTVDDIKLKTGKQAYQIQQIGRQPFNGTNDSMEEGDLRNTINKVVAFAIMQNGPDVSDKVINGLLNGEFVIIRENKSKNDTDKNAFEVIGLDMGARCTSLTRNMYENMASYMVEMTEAGTPNAPIFFWNTDYTTTRGKVEALLTPAT